MNMCRNSSKLQERARTCFWLKINPSILSKFGLPGIESPIWRVLAAFLTRRWFQRGWVVQEVSMAQHIEVLCGKGTVEWEHITLMSVLLDRRVILRGRADGIQCFT